MFLDPHLTVATFAHPLQELNILGQNRLPRPNAELYSRISHTKLSGNFLKITLKPGELIFAVDIYH